MDRDRDRGQGRRGGGNRGRNRGENRGGNRGGGRGQNRGGNRGGGRGNRVPRGQNGAPNGYANAQREPDEPLKPIGVKKMIEALEDKEGVDLADFCGSRGFKILLQVRHVDIL